MAKLLGIVTMKFETPIVNIYLDDVNVDDTIVNIFKYYTKIIRKLYQNEIIDKNKIHTIIEVRFNIINRKELKEKIQQLLKNNDVQPLNTPFGVSSVLYHDEDKILINTFSKALSIHNIIKKNKKIIISVKVYRDSLERVTRDILSSILSGFLEVLPLHSLSIVIENKAYYNLLPYIILIIGYGKTGKSTLGRTFVEIGSHTAINFSSPILVCSDDYNFLLNNYVIPFTYSSFLNHLDVEKCIEAMLQPLSKTKLVIGFIVSEEYSNIDLSELYPISWRGFWYLRYVFRYSVSQVNELVRKSLYILKNKLGSYSFSNITFTET